MSLVARLVSRLAQSPISSSGSRLFSSEGATPATSSTIIGACVLERLPLVVPETPEWEKEYKAWQQQLQLQKRIVKEYPRVSKRAQAVAAGLVKQEEEGSQHQGVELTPTTTAADASGDVSTMMRRLGQHVYLLVSQGQGWSFPKAAHQQGETIRQTAERALAEAIGTSCPVYFIGNAPMAHLEADVGASSTSTSSTSSTSTSSSNVDAAISTFYMLAQVQKDPWPVQLSDSYDACAWVTREELPQYLPQDEASLAQKMLP